MSTQGYPSPTNPRDESASELFVRMAAASQRMAVSVAKVQDAMATITEGIRNSRERRAYARASGQVLCATEHTEWTARQGCPLCKARL